MNLCPIPIADSVPSPLTISRQRCARARFPGRPCLGELVPKPHCRFRALAVDDISLLVFPKDRHSLDRSILERPDPGESGDGGHQSVPA